MEAIEIAKEPHNFKPKDGCNKVTSCVTCLPPVKVMVKVKVR
jgi:hypothetical protein